jgi:TonB family protein
MKRMMTMCQAVLVLAAVAAGMAASSGGVNEAIALYQAARYAEALEVLDALEAGTGNDGLEASVRDAADQYRALCLFALDRQPEARAALQALLERRPDYVFQEADLPPRFLAVVREVQAEVLPAVARSEYRAGKASYDRRSYGEAQRRLRRVVTIAEADGVPPEVLASIEDLAVLCRGFLALIGSSRVDAVAALPPAKFAAPAPPRPAVPYTAADRQVTPPTTIEQELPNWPAVVATSFMGARRKGTLEMIIDEKGKVASARLTQSVHPLYDQRLLAAARRWQYKPATKDGKPVPFRKTLEVQFVGNDVPK